MLVDCSKIVVREGRHGGDDAEGAVSLFSFSRGDGGGDSNFPQLWDFSANFLSI